MSYDLFVYSAGSQIARREELVARLRSRDWVSLAVSAPARRTLPDGPLEYDLLVGARNPETAEWLRRVLLSGDELDLGSAPHRDYIASCTVAAVAEYEISREEVTQLTADFGSQCAEFMRAAAVKYEIHTSTSRTTRCCAFQEDVCDCLASLVGGLIEDPQAGSFYLHENGLKREIVREVSLRGPGADLAAQFHRFVERARACGFSTQGKGAGSSVITKDLGLDEMERLLELAHKCVHDPSLSASEMLLNEYVSERGPTFAAQNRAWIGQMRRRYGLATRSPGGLWNLVRNLWNRG